MRHCLTQTHTHRPVARRVLNVAKKAARAAHSPNLAACKRHMVLKHKPCKLGPINTTLGLEQA